MDRKLASALGIFAGLQTCIVIAWASGNILMLSSWASSSALIWNDAHAPASGPKSVAAGHLIGGLCGILALASLHVMPAHSEIFLAAPFVALAGYGMSWARVYHPPAAANAAIALFGAVNPSSYALSVAVGSILLMCVASVARWLNRADSATKTGD